jgi:hypothetical protein
MEVEAKSAKEARANATNFNAKYFKGCKTIVRLATGVEECATLLVTKKTET